MATDVKFETRAKAEVKPQSSEDSGPSLFRNLGDIVVEEIRTRLAKLGKSLKREHPPA